MTYTIQDIAGLIVAVAAVGVVMLLPGIALGQIAGVFAFRKVRSAWTYGLALVIGQSTLPAADSLLCGSLGLGAALAFNLGLAAYGLRVLWMKRLPRPERVWLAAGAIWLVLLVIVWIDIDSGTGLYPSLLMVDVVKHAATVRALVESGIAPPIDPFFLRDDPAGYYYFYYLLSALAERLCAGFIDSRAAVGGQIFWTGVALVGLTTLLFRKAGLRARPSLPLLLAVMAAAGLQILPVIGLRLGQDLWLGQTNWWNAQVVSWPLSVLWVPQHVAGLIACWTGFLALAGALQDDRGTSPHRAWAIALAAAAFASAAGLSIWVTLGAVAVAAVWMSLLAGERRWRAVLTIAAAGALSGVIALPYLVDLLHDRAYGAAPVALAIRAFSPADAMFAPGLARNLARLVALPLNYLIELGVFLVGSYVFWRQGTLAAGYRGEAARLVTISALVGIIMASFTKSTIVNNDLGWRVILFTQMAALLWTMAVLARPAQRPLAANGPLAAEGPSPWRERLQHAPAAIVIALLVGYCGSLYDLVGLRAFWPLGMSTEAAGEETPGDPRIDREMRAAYAWLAAHADHHLVLQHNPDAERTFAYGLYGRSRVAVSDRHNARLFGAPERDIEQRLDEVIPVFEQAMSAGEAALRLGHNHVAAVMLTANDPVWHDKASWVWAIPPLYASEHVRVVSVNGAAP